jgi:hypothetical protein
VGPAGGHRLQENTLTIHHGDGDLRYAVASDRETGFVLDEPGSLSFSIRSEGLERGQWPSVFFVAAHGIRLSDTLAAGRELRAVKGARAETVVQAYYSEHAARVEVALRIVEVREDELVVDLEVITEDVLYEGDKARPSRTTGRVTLPRVARAALWAPRNEEG